VSGFIDERREDFAVECICETLGVSASAYYRRATGEPSARVLEDERLLPVISETHKRNDEAYGCRRMWKALLRAGETGPRCQVQRLMADNGIQGAKRRGKPWRTTRPGKDAQRHPDLVSRDFTGADVQLVHHSDAGSQLRLNRSSQQCAVSVGQGQSLSGECACLPPGLETTPKGSYLPRIDRGHQRSRRPQRVQL